MNIVLMLNAWIFITNKHESDGQLALEHQKHPNLMHVHRVLGPLSPALVNQGLYPQMKYRRSTVTVLSVAT